MIGLLVVMLVVLVTVAFIGQPIYTAALEGRREGRADKAEADRMELEAERDAKLREIRDAELDWRTGKLTEADWQQLDAALRADAAEILKKLDATQQLSGEQG
jgi:hypothetical protein